MSLYIYVDEHYMEIPSLEIKEITEYNILLDFIKKKINTNKNIDVYSNFSILETIEILKCDFKINTNFLVFSENDYKLILLTNVNTHNNDYFKIPKKLTYTIFKLFNKNIFTSSNVSQELNNNDNIYEYSKKKKLFYSNAY